MTDDVELIAGHLREALNTLESGVGDRDTLEMKLQALGAGLPPDGNES